MRKDIAIVILLLLTLSIYIPVYSIEKAMAKNIEIVSTNTALDTNTVEFSYSGRTGLNGHVVYSPGLGVYLVVWIRVRGTFYFGTDEVEVGDVYVAIIDPSNPSSPTILLIDDSDKAFYIDAVVAGDNSFLIGYSIVESDGTHIDVKYVLIKNNGGTWQAVLTWSPYNDNSNNETLAGASYMNGKYLLIWWYYYSTHNAGDLYWAILNESAESVSGPYSYLATNNRPWYASYLIIPNPVDNLWLVVYTKYNSGTYTDIYACPIYTDGSKGYYKLVINDTTHDKLEYVVGGTYTNGKYVFAYTPGYEKYLVIYDYNTEDVDKILLSSDAQYPIVINGSETILVVWRDLVDDPDSHGGNVYAKLIDPTTWNVSDTIDISWDTSNNYYESHIFASHVPGKEYYVIAWSRSVNIGGSWFKRIYMVLLNETMNDPSIIETTPMEVVQENHNHYVHGVASDGSTILVGYKRDSYAYVLQLTINTDIPEPPIANKPTSVWAYFTPWEAEEAENKIIDLIENAKYYVYVEMYLWGNSSNDDLAKNISDALADAVSRGVDVKVILDEYNVNDAAETYLESRGVEVKRESGDGILHSKYFVIDDKYAVIMSANLKYYNFYSDYNNIVIINNTRLAQNLKIEFQEKWSGSSGVFHAGAPTIYSEIDTVINGSTGKIWSFIGPDDNDTYKDLIYQLLDGASNNIYLMFYDFTNGTIANLLIQKKNEGLDVRGIFEAGQYWANTTAHEYDWLVNNGVLVTLDKDNYNPSAGDWYPYMHHKVFIIDNRYVYFGSAHPTYYGWNLNDEVIVIIDSQLIAQAFVSAFERIWARYTIRVDVTVTVNGVGVSGAQISVTDYGNGTDIDRTYTTGVAGVAHVYLVHPYYHANVTDKDYTFTITYTGYPSVTKILTLSTGEMDTLTINYIDTSLTASCPATGEVETPFTCTLTISGNPQGPSTADVLIKINGTDWKTVTITGGSGSVDIAINNSGPATIEFVYNGGEEEAGYNIYNEYTSATDTETVDIELKSTSTSIVSIEPDSPTAGDTITVTARVLFSNGTPVVGAIVKFIYNGTVVHQQNTNETGYATDTYTVSTAGTLTIEVVYDGVPGKYAGSSNSTTISVGGGAPAPTTVETEITITGDSEGYIYESGTYTIELKYKENGSIIPISASITIYINGTAQTVSLTNGVYTRTVDYTALGPLNITVVFPDTTIGSTTYLQSIDTLIVTVNKRPVNLTVSYSANWVNETHVYIEINGSVKDGLNGTDLSGTIKIWVRKDTTWNLVATLSVTGTFSWNGTVDPSEVRVTFEPASPAIASPTEPGGGSVVLSLPVNPYIPAPEPIYILYALLVALIVLLKKYSK